MYYGTTDVFDVHPGRVKKYEYSLKLKPQVLYQTLWSTNIKEHSWERELGKMEKRSITERINSQYNKPIMVISKKSGDVRIVLDARHVNKFLERERRPSGEH